MNKENTSSPKGLQVFAWDLDLRLSKYIGLRTFGFGYSCIFVFCRLQGFRVQGSFCAFALSRSKPASLRRGPRRTGDAAADTLSNFAAQGVV